jgi:hypothetical protein
MKTINENIKGNPGTVKCSEAEINYDVQYEDCDCYFNKRYILPKNCSDQMEK